MKLVQLATFDFYDIKNSGTSERNCAVVSKFLCPRKMEIHAARPISFKYVLRAVCSSAVGPLLTGVHTGSPTK